MNEIEKLVNKVKIKDNEDLKLGMSVSEFEKLLNEGCKDNANLSYNPELLTQYTFEATAKEYALMKMPEECAKAYKEGYIHIHDLHAYMTRPNCFNADLRFFAKNGLKIDGKGDSGSVAKPAKSLEVMLNHMLQAWMAGATVFSGGQGFVNFNTLLAPFARGRSYQEIKQALQGFSFNCNMSLICRGGQTLFSNIGVDLSCPPELADEPAICPGGVVEGTYKDYQEEADLIFRAICEVIEEKDGQGAYHRFPNWMFNIRKGDLDEYSGNCRLLHELGANNPTIYYVNCVDQERSVMGCFSGDTRLHFKYKGIYFYETFSFINTLINPDSGVSEVNDFEILGLDKNNNKITWVKPEYFIKNVNRQIYKVDYENGKSFYCDDTHTVIDENGERVNIIVAFRTKKNILDVDANSYMVNINSDLQITTTKIKSVESTHRFEHTYCFEANDSIVVDEFILTGQCRTSLPKNYTEDYEKDCCNTGNFQYNTINLPLIALDADGDMDKFYKKLDEICEICYTSLIHRRKCVIDTIYNKHMSDFLLQTDKDTGEPLWDIDRTTITLGYCGLNECLEVLVGKNITDEFAENIGVGIIQFLNSKKEEFHERDGLRWSVIASPAESTAGRFAKIIQEKYPDFDKLQGTKDAPYLTNSHHIPVDFDGRWVSHIWNASKFHNLSLGGAILHIWSGEVWSDAEAIWKLNKKMIEQAHPIFWAYSKVFTYCKECSFTINDKLEVCPICGSKDLKLFDRITGYYLGVDTFNPSKKQEFEDRFRFEDLTAKKFD